MRKEVNLDEEVIELLQSLADKKKWSLKKYMEHVLELYSKKAEPVLLLSKAEGKLYDKKYNKIAKELKLPKRKQSNKK